jgi:hypothetical protein
MNKPLKKTSNPLQEPEIYSTNPIANYANGK